MTRENTLFAVVGLLLGYVIAFHLVVHINQTRVDGGDGSLPAGHPAIAGDSDAQRLKSAADTAARAADDAPKDFDAQLKAGEAYIDAGGFDDAAAYLARASSLKPDNLDVRSELAVTYFMRTPPQRDKAVAELRRNLSSDPNHLPSLHNLTRMLIEMGKADEAEATLEKIEKVNPNYPQLEQLRAEIEEARHAGAAAPADAGKGAKKSPTD
jgi:tetratricopeptide (TPR) repeat protein